MADGSQIGVTEMHVVAPTAQNTTLTFTGNNAFIYDRGVGRATLIGTTGADVLIDNSTGGGDRLEGRAGDDYLIGGTGANVFAPGDGQDYALIRGGAARVEVNAQSAGRIEIEGFRPGTDIIALTGSTSLTAVLASARSDGYGGTLLTISSERTIRLNGLAPTSITVRHVRRQRRQPGRVRHQQRAGGGSRYQRRRRGYARAGINANNTDVRRRPVGDGQRADKRYSTSMRATARR